MSRFLTAFEHQPLSVGPESDLSDPEAEVVGDLGLIHRGFCERMHGAIRLAQYCGVVNLGPRILEILPKVDQAEAGRETVLRLLRHSPDSPSIQHSAAGQRSLRAPLLEAFIAAFFDAFLEVVRGGLMRRYLERNEDLFCLRGRIDCHRQFGTLANRMDLVACSFDELTADNIWNRIVKAALRAARPCLVSTEIKRRWVELMSVLDEVSDVEIQPVTLRRLRFDRQAARYRSVIDWARRILLFLSPSLRAGMEEAPALLFDMNRLFESAVAAKIRRSLPAGLGLRSQSSRFLATLRGSAKPGAIEIRPDLILHRRDEVEVIGDTKWKLLEVDSSGYLKPHQDDVYQMLAYGAAYGCNRLTLIYPYHSGLSSARETILDLPKTASGTPSLSIVAIDVGSDGMHATLGSKGDAFTQILKPPGSDRRRAGQTKKPQRAPGLC